MRRASPFPMRHAGGPMHPARSDWKRRDFLRASAALGAAALVPGCRSLGLGDSGSSPDPRRVFAHGVASGDPQSDRVVLWTRVSPVDASQAIAVRWELATDPGFSRIAARGVTETHAGRDFTVKVDPEGLAAGATYYYRFDALGDASPVGRTRTLPTGRVERVRFGVASCSNHPQGYFNAYRSLAERADLSAVLHLGDYIYEYGPRGYGGDAGLGRDHHPPLEIVALGEYRERYAQYRSDPDLQEVHRQHPMIAVWDDHESANNSWKDGAENHQPESEGEWRARKAAAIRSYFEWMPIRELPGDLDRGRIYRSMRYGDLVDLVMLDTRLEGRDRQADREDLAALRDPERSILGAAQEAWLRGELRTSRDAGTAWRVLGQQVLVAGLAGRGQRLNPDTWDGYHGSRNRLLGGLREDRVDDVVVLTGDYHSSWAAEVADDPFDSQGYDRASGRGLRAVEFVTPAVSSAPLSEIEGLRERFEPMKRTHEHIRWYDIDHHGAVVLDIDRERTQAEWWFQETVEERRANERFGRGFAVERGSKRLGEVAEPSAPAPEAEPAPAG